MPRYDSPPTNKEVFALLNAVRRQSVLIMEHLTILTTVADGEAPDETFSNTALQDGMTDIALSVKNFAAEVDRLWKRTRR